MKSQWFKKKESAIKLRVAGHSIRNIEQRLGIQRSTLSGWFKNISLTTEQKENLKQITRNKVIKNLENARKKAVEWHHKQKKVRLNTAKSEALHTLSEVDINNKYVMELALSLLYLGEGAKTPITALGNSNPAVLKFFIKCMIDLYGVDLSNIKCELHLRADQNVETVKSFWATQLKIPKSNFRYCVDKRTVGKKTYNNYNGVCTVVCGSIAIQRRLMFLVDEYFKKLSIEGVIAQW